MGGDGPTTEPRGDYKLTHNPKKPKKKGRAVAVEGPERPSASGRVAAKRGLGVSVEGPGGRSSSIRAVTSRW